METNLERFAICYEGYLRQTALGNHDQALERIELAIEVAPVAMLPWLTGQREACAQRVRFSQRVSAWESFFARFGKGRARG